MCADRRAVLINASHAHTGGGVVYLRHVIGLLGQARDIDWIVAAPKQALDSLDLPGWRKWAAPSRGFLFGHLWEQLVLPVRARWAGAQVTLCNATYVPLLAPRPVPILHCAVTDCIATANGLGSRLYWGALYVLTWASLKRCDYVLTTASHLVEDYAPGRALRRRGRVVLAPPGVPSQPAGESRDDNLLVAIGDLYPHKDYETLIRAMSLIIQDRPQARLVILGRQVDDGYAQQLVRLADDLGLSHAVDFTGGLPHGETMRWLATAALMLSASKAETTSMVVVEAMAVGTPSVVRDLPFQRAVADGAAIFVRSNDALDVGFANAVLGALSDRQRWMFMQAAGRALATRYDWNRTAAAVLSVVRRALAGSD